MLLEKVKFLEEAIKIARNEIYEETEALEEGGDVKVSILSIRSIIDDLLSSSVDFQVEEERVSDSIDGEYSLSEKIASVILISLSRDVHSFLFDVGDTVKSKGVVKTPDPFWCAVYDKKELHHLSDFPRGSTGTIVERRPPVGGFKHTYLVERDGKHFVVEEDFVEFIDRTCSWKFDVGERVRYDNRGYFPASEFYVASGYDEDETPFSDVPYGETLTFTILSRFSSPLHVCTNAYAVLSDDSRLFFMAEYNLEKI